jgi:2-aminoethylphosphonate-pyruvate transaminase
VRAGLAALGIGTVIPPEQSSVVLRAYRLPAGVTYAALHAIERLLTCVARLLE